MSFYVYRKHEDGRDGWVGPIRSTHQADREVAAWQQSGWQAEKLDATPELRKAVNARYRVSR